MGAPTPTTQAYENGNVYHLSWTATWSDTTNLSDTAVIDVSGMTSPFTGGVKLIKGWVNASAGIGVLLEFDDDSTDELILEHPVGASGHIPFDFRDSPSGGKTYKGGQYLPATTLDNFKKSYQAELNKLGFNWSKVRGLEPKYTTAAPIHTPLRGAFPGGRFAPK